MNNIIKYEKNKYFKTKKEYIKNMLLNTDDFCIWKFQKKLRKAEKYMIKSYNNPIYKICYYFLKKRRIKLGRKFGITISEGVFEEGLRIYHLGNIVVNPNAHIGKNCIIVGNLCIGNVKGENTAPVLKDNVMLGWGCTLIGNIVIETNVKVAAGAVVTKSVLQSNVTVAGIPAKIIKGEEN